ncbi:MAG: peptidoglycan DD-metalloendopeptidase family protein [Anaerolineales bacterium]
MRSKRIERRFLTLAILTLFVAACAPPVGEPAVELSAFTAVTPTAVPNENEALLNESAERSARLEAAVPAAPQPVTFPTTIPEPDLGWRPPPYPVPWALQPQDHFYFSRPIASDEVNWPNPQYRYGSTLLGEEDLHTGIDMSASRYAPVHAAGPGEVVWSGYGLYRGVEDETDPYGLSVAIKHDFGYDGQPLYTVYAHMSEVYVWRGQRVESGEVIGQVGETGDASGPHLHFEVRLGENRYFSTRNPELWIVPPEGWAVLVGRIEDSWGRLLPEVMIQIRSLDTDRRVNVWTYAREDTIHPDDYYNENYAISDLPAGPYEITYNFVGHTFSAQFWLQPGKVNVVHFNGRDGFEVLPAPTPVSLDQPPQ